MTQRIAFPSFGEEELTPYQMRQLVSALELRFQAIETDVDSGFYDNLTASSGDLSALYSPIGHTHTADEITGAISTSIFDLSDVTGTPTTGQTLIWDGSAYVPGAASSSGATALNDLTDVNAFGADGSALLYQTATRTWVAGSVESALGSPLADGYVLSSTTGGVRSWIPVGGVDLTGYTQASVDETVDGSWNFTNPRIDFGDPAGTVPYEIFLRSGPNDDARMFFGETDDHYGGSIGLDATNNYFELRTHNLSAAGQVLMWAHYATDYVTFPGVVRLTERAASIGDAAGLGQLWIKNDAPNVLYFTDDAGTDHNLLETSPANFLRHVTVGYDSGDVTVSGTAPVTPAQGEIWFDTSGVFSVDWTDIINIQTFTSVLDGIVPASGGGTANFLRADGTWAAAGLPANNFIRHVTTGYDNGDVVVSGTEPVTPAQGDIWFDTSASFAGSTTLEIGTQTSTTLAITSDGAVDDVVLPAANGTQAGLLSSAKLAEINANTAKVGNVTHTGEVTGSTALTLNVTAISNRLAATADSVDDAIIRDDTDGALKKTALSTITDGGYF